VPAGSLLAAQGGQGKPIRSAQLLACLAAMTVPTLCADASVPACALLLALSPPLPLCHHHPAPPHPPSPGSARTTLWWSPSSTCSSTSPPPSSAPTVTAWARCEWRPCPLFFPLPAPPPPPTHTQPTQMHVHLHAP
jgi:hypothetical protein